MSTDLVARLRAHANRDNCVSHDWGGEPVDAGEDCEAAADEIERLQSQLGDFHNLEDMAEIRRLKALLGSVLEDGWRDADIPLVMRRRGIAPMDVTWTHYSPATRG